MKLITFLLFTFILQMLCTRLKQTAGNNNIFFYAQSINFYKESYTDYSKSHLST